MIVILLGLAFVSVLAGMSLPASGSLTGLRAVAGGALAMAAVLPFLIVDRMAAGPRGAVGAAVLGYGLLLLWVPGRGRARQWLTRRREITASEAGEDRRPLAQAPWF
ncbi:hypothetical protein GA0070616_0094 [Micromonospora nigra]|uniref:Uncharacterized protein n=1 Tax=Micromonospora nigra TaxID=145857 RepID=A0A1C6R7J5_9ACTN|nr:hypothetical protein [Micromonospora nigra]SCL12999.1 hypothetical protein GA0070616_0094 [Micromonospora nigra]